MKEISRCRWDEAEVSDDALEVGRHRPIHVNKVDEEGVKVAVVNSYTNVPGLVKKHIAERLDARQSSEYWVWTTDAGAAPNNCGTANEKFFGLLEQLGLATLFLHGALNLVDMLRLCAGATDEGEI
jgi:hypothetical protein